MSNFDQTFKIVNEFKTNLKTVIKGKDETIDLLLTALFAGGHILIQDYPGSGKTTLGKSLAMLIDNKEDFKSFSRIQFTPDMLPADIIGANIFNKETNSFNFQSGPVFGEVILADEINRAGPKVQAAFIEAMAEKQVTVDSITYKLSDLFFVIGTQNPIDLAGTYPLPLVQLDRFLLKIPMSYVDSKTEFEIINESEKIKNNLNNLKPIINSDELYKLTQTRLQINISDKITQAIVELIQSTRNNENILMGASTRSAIMFKNALQAFALIKNKDYVDEDDFKYLARFVLEHRMKYQILEFDFDSILNPIIDTLV